MWNILSSVSGLPDMVREHVDIERARECLFTYSGILTGRNENKMGCSGVLVV